ncbi:MULTISPECIES: MotE family protein [unclassified Nitrospina]|uniref:MotE family protein n=1 Tax=unclassified Nitrospina TaxID=2638683 RepID=UPI003F9A3236
MNDTQKRLRKLPALLAALLLAGTTLAGAQTGDSTQPKSESGSGNTKGALHLPSTDKSRLEMNMETFRMLEMIEKKNRELEKREEELALREKNLKDLEKKVRSDLQKIEEALARSEEQVGIKRDLIQKNVESLVKMYSSMKATEAATLLENMDQDIAVQILSKMKSRDAGAVLGKMNTQVAKNLTEKIAGKPKKP